MGKATPALGRREVAEWLAPYRPSGVAGELWDGPLGLFVRDSIAQLDPIGVASARRTATVLSALAAWCLGEGLPLDVEVLLDPDTVERFVSVGLRNDQNRGTYRSVLRRIGPRLTKRAPWEPRPEPVCRRQVTVPYSLAELAGLWRDAQRQSTSALRRSALALVALGAGAGLDGRWVTRVAPEDVTTAGIAVGEPAARVVPVVAEFADSVDELAWSCPAGEFLVGGRSLSRNRASYLAARLELAADTPRLNCSRLRSTWLVGHLDRGTRLPELVAMAGLKGLTVLSDLLPYVAAS
jgi:hypothetical protein